MKPLDPMRLIRWTSGATVPSDLPISDTDPDPGLFGPDSITWRLHKEQWLIAAGGRAFLLQAAHPVVAQGALDHSRFAEDPYGRVYNTVHAMSGLIFGTTREANAIAQRINRLHHTVTGTLSESVAAGRHAAGTPYSAMDVPGLLWVHAAFVDSIISAYTSFVGPLSLAEREQYWQESCRYARRLGLTDADLPPSYPALQSYIRQAIATGEVAVGAGARTIAQTILYPPMPWYRRPLWAIIQIMTIGQLPDELRCQYGVANPASRSERGKRPKAEGWRAAPASRSERDGIRWHRRNRVAFRVVCAVVRLLRRLLPQLLGESMVYSFAQRRVRGELAHPAPESLKVASS